MTALGVFWAEWERRQPGERRSLERARLLVEQMGFAAGRPVLTVVGSKGKGTAATYASAYLAAAGLRAVTVTSPALRSVRDRIRCQGTALSAEDLTGLARQIGQARRRLPPYEPSGGYLSPSGLFIIGGAVYARTVNADVLVLEAGMGGKSDEVSLFPPSVLGITEIFGEHLGVLGATPVEIARDKAGVVTPTTGAVVSLPQQAPVAQALTETVADGSGGRIGVEYPPAGASGIPARLLPASFGRRNAELGCAAAQRLLDITAAAAPPGDALSATLSSVVLPGRSSWHAVPGTDVCIFANAAINRAGVSAALTEVYRRWEHIDWVLACFPDHKHVTGAIAELDGLPVSYVRLTDKPRLSFTHKAPDRWEVVDAQDVDRDFLAARGRRIAVVGTGYFIARMLGLADADTERLFVVPRG